MKPENEIKDTRENISPLIVHSKKISEKLIAVSKQSLEDLKQLRKLIAIKPPTSIIKTKANLRVQTVE
jgi:hypothetical protein